MIQFEADGQSRLKKSVVTCSTRWYPPRISTTKFLPISCGFVEKRRLHWFKPLYTFQKISIVTSDTGWSKGSETNLDLSEHDGGAVITRSLVIFANSAELDSLKELIQWAGIEAAVGPGQLAILDGEARVALSRATVKNIAVATDEDWEM